MAPQLTGFSPLKGKGDDTITLNGAGLIQAEKITLGGTAVTTYTVNSDAKLTTKVPAGAKTGDIEITTPGGSVKSKTAFKVSRSRHGGSRLGAAPALTVVGRKTFAWARLGRDDMQL